MSYQWKKNGANIQGATRSTYVTPPTTLADNGSLFAVVVSNSVGSVTSHNAQLVVRPGSAKSDSDGTSKNETVAFNVRPAGITFGEP